MERGPALEKLGKLMQAFGSKRDYGKSLFDKEKAQVSKEGMIRLLAMGEPSGALEFSENADGSWTRRKQGDIRSPFLSVQGTSKRSFVFFEPFSAMKQHGQDLFSMRSRTSGLLVLLEPDKTQVDVFVARDRNLKELVFVHSGSKEMHKAELDFFNTLKARYASFDIKVEITTQKALFREGPELSR